MNQITKFKSNITRFAFSALAVVLLLGNATPIVAFADTPATAPSTSTAPTTSSTAPAATTTSASAPAPANPTPATASTPPSTGPVSPTGPDASTYTYNSATGLWENQYYTWNPTTGQTSPKTTPTYSYNPATGMWDTTHWKFDPASGTYVPNVTSVATPPSGAITSGGPTSTAPAIDGSTGSSSGSAQPQHASVVAPSVGSGLSMSSTPAAGTTGIKLGASNNTTFDTFFNAGISNGITSFATTGNATVSGNTSGGNATSGNANDNANILNMLQSTASLLGNNAATFVSNIYGNVQGDILINPTNIAQPTTSSTTADANFKLNSQNSGQINNNINLNAASGDAAVTQNTSGGNATTGNASAVANVVNLLNSMISAKQSFLGVVNIYGNLTGNIVVPQEFMDQLLATNAPTTSIDASAINQFSSIVNNNQSINNTIDANAASGTATVANNTTGGSATTGSSSNKVTVFNLTGSQFIGADTMLVFVNVMGQWVGVMMNAPAGTTAAAYGSGVNSNTAVANNANVNVNNNQSINNAIKATATTGNASVSQNTTGGNATTGNASTAVNLLNLTNDQFSLSHWFGVLFINVFGNWYGNFGVSKPVVASAMPDVGGSSGITTANTGVKVFRFVPASSSTGTTTGSTSTSPSATPTPGEFQLANSRLAKELTSLKTPAKPSSPSPSTPGIQLIQIVGAGIFMGGLSLFGVEQFMKHHAASRSV